MEPSSRSIETSSITEDNAQDSKRLDLLGLLDLITTLGCNSTDDLDLSTISRTYSLSPGTFQTLLVTLSPLLN